MLSAPGPRRVDRAGLQAHAAERDGVNVYPRRAGGARVCQVAVTNVGTDVVPFRQFGPGLAG
jgi:hypothetical protein